MSPTVQRRLMLEAKVQQAMKHRVALNRAMKDRVVIALTRAQLESFMRFQATDPIMQNDFAGGMKH